MLKHTFFTEVLLSNPYRLRLIVDYVQIYLERRRGKEEQAEFVQKCEEIIKGLQAHSWKDLEVGHKFRHNEKLDLITADSVIVGCDIGSVKHFIRAIDAQGRALTNKPFPFENDEEGFKAAYDWMVGVAAQDDKTQIVLALEPTGHYWFCFAAWCTSHGITVVQVNPYAVKATKEIQDNSQLKSDRKDPGVIAELAKNGNYLYFPGNLITLGNISAQYFQKSA